MDELPSEARSVLELAKGAQEGADVATRQRVRAGVEGALAAAALLQAERASASLGKPLNGAKGFLTTSKVMLASSALLFGAGAALWGAHARVASRPERPAAVEPALAAPPPTANGASKQTESIVAAYVDVRSAKPVVPRRRTELLPARLAARSDATRASVESQREASDTGQALAAEMSLLSAAEEALARGDLGKARSALSEHQRRFAQPKLREERDGLGVLARCKEQPESAHKQALAFVHKSPSSMLTARIKEACGLNDDG